MQEGVGVWLGQVRERWERTSISGAAKSQGICCARNYQPQCIVPSRRVHNPFEVTFHGLSNIFEWHGTSRAADLRMASKSIAIT